MPPKEAERLPLVVRRLRDAYSANAVAALHSAQSSSLRVLFRGPTTRKEGEALAPRGDPDTATYDIMGCACLDQKRYFAIYIPYHLGLSMLIKIQTYIIRETLFVCTTKKHYSQVI